MKNQQNEALEKIQTSKSWFNDAQRHLGTGEAINWFCDELRSALLWAMEAWLIYHGHRPDHGNGWVSMQFQFLGNAPKELRSKVSHCLSEETFLEYELEGDLDFKEPIPPIEEWKEKAYACLSETEAVIAQIEKEVTGNDNSQFSQ